MRTPRDHRRTAWPAGLPAGLLTLALLAAGCGGGDRADRADRGDPRAGPASPSERRAGAPTATPGASVRVAPRPGFRPARGAAELARRITAAEDAVRSPATPPATLRSAAFEAQLLYRQLARRDRWVAPVLTGVPPRHRATVRAHVVARRAFRSLHHTLSPTLPAWRIVRPAPARELLAHYREGERRFGVPWEVLAAVNLVETGFGRIRGTSIAGARGPMQFMPATWAAFGRGDVDDPHDAIIAAARYLAHNGAGAGRIDQALYRYNNHAGYVRGVKAYASVIARHRRAFLGLYHWQVLFLSRIGDVWLPEGYHRREPVPVRRYVARHPERHLGTSTR